MFAATAVKVEAKAPPAQTADLPASSRPEGVPRAVRQMEPGRFKGGDFSRQVHCAVAFDDTTPEDLMRADYWAHVADRVSQYDRIEVLSNDGTWWAELMVVACGRAYVRVNILRTHALDALDTDLAQAAGFKEYHIVHRGPFEKWSVVRRSDQTVVHSGEADLTKCEAWLKDHLKVIAR